MKEFFANYKLETCYKRSFLYPLNIWNVIVNVEEMYVVQMSVDEKHVDETWESVHKVWGDAWVLLLKLLNKTESLLHLTIVMWRFTVSHFLVSSVHYVIEIFNRFPTVFTFIYACIQFTLKATGNILQYLTAYKQRTSCNG